MNRLPNIQTAATLPPRASSLRAQPILHDLSQDPNHALIFRSQSSRQDIAPLVQLTSPQRVGSQQPSLSEALTKQLTHLKQVLQQQHLSFTQKKNLRETKYTYEEVLNAPNLEQEIQKWRGSLPNSERQALCPKTWKSYKNTLPNAEAFSAFLHKMRVGFNIDLFHLRVSFRKGIYNRQKAAFAEHRLLPVLRVIQDNPTLAKRLFCMAEDGLGTCHDRPALTFIDIELETQCFLVLQKLEAAHLNRISTNPLQQELIHLEAQKYRKQYTVSLLIKAFRGATYGDLDPLQTVLMNYGKIAQETRYFPPLPYHTCTGFVPEEEQTERKECVVNHLRSISRASWKTRLEAHLQTTDNWFKVLNKAFPDLQTSMRALQDTRLKDSESLIGTNTPLDQTYVLQLEAINLTYEKKKAALFDNPNVRAFTRQQVSNYLYTYNYF